MRKIILSILTLAYLEGANSQCIQSNNAFKANETVIYSAYYNWNFIWVNAGEVTFSTKLVDKNKTPSYLLKAIGSTYKGYDFFYSVRDTFEAIVDTAYLEPSYYMQSSNEGRFNSHQQYWFNQASKVVKTSVQMEKEPTITKESPFDGCASDVLSMVYKCRNMDFSKYKYDEKIPITLILDGKIEHLYIRYLGIEEVEDRQNRHFKCYKFAPCLPKNALFSGGEEMIVWVTTDANRIPIVVEAKILIGSVKAIFLDIKNPRNPLEVVK